MFVQFIKVAATMLLLVAVIGCGNTETGGHAGTAEHAGPESFSEAAEQLVMMKNKIRDGFASGDVDSAHGPLHEVGHLLDDMAMLAKKENLPAEQMTAVEEAKETLFDAFGEIDKTLHGGEGSTYDEKAEMIQAAMKVVVEAAGVTDGS